MAPSEAVQERRAERAAKQGQPGIAVTPGSQKKGKATKTCPPSNTIDPKERVEVQKKTYVATLELNKQLAKDVNRLGKIRDGVPAKDEQIRNLLEENSALSTRLREVIAKLKAARGKKTKSTKWEWVKGVTDKVGEHIRDVLFRTIKFVNTEKSLEAATIKCWEAVKDDLNLDSEAAKEALEGTGHTPRSEFIRIYASFVSGRFSHCRQYVQSRGQDAAKGTNWGKFCPNWFVFILFLPVLTLHVVPLCRHL